MSRLLRDLKYGNSNLQFLQKDRSFQNDERRMLINVFTSKRFEIAQSPRFSWGTMSWRTQISLGLRRLKLLPLVLILLGLSYYKTLIIKKTADRNSLFPLSLNHVMNTFCQDLIYDQTKLTVQRINEILGKQRVLEAKLAQ